MMIEEIAKEIDLGPDLIEDLLTEQKEEEMKIEKVEVVIDKGVVEGTDQVQEVLVEEVDLEYTIHNPKQINFNNNSYYVNFLTLK